MPGVICMSGSREKAERKGKAAERGRRHMAGTVVHLLVAERLYRELSQIAWSYPFDDALSFQRDFFIAGNICPDGIMARKNYERSMKLHTHFRDDIPDGSFEAPGNIEKFEKRLKAFLPMHGEDEKKCPGLYLGYVTHMMTDERFILEERPKFFEEIKRIGLTIYDRETYEHFNKETDLVDFKLIREFEELQCARDSLERVLAYEIKGMITKEELTDSRKWILKHFFYEEHPCDEPQFLSYESMVRFIGTITEEIVERLFTEGYLVRN